MTREQQLEKAEALARELPQGADNEMKRVARFFSRYRNYDRMLELLACTLPPRGGQERQRWQEIQGVLRNRTDLSALDPDETAFILAWTARLLKA